MSRESYRSWSAVKGLLRKLGAKLDTCVSIAMHAGWRFLPADVQELINGQRHIRRTLAHPGTTTNQLLGEAVMELKKMRADEPDAEEVMRRYLTECRTKGKTPRLADAVKQSARLGQGYKKSRLAVTKEWKNEMGEREKEKLRRMGRG